MSTAIETVDPADALQLASVLIEALERELVQARANERKAREMVEQLEREVDDLQSLGTVAHRFVETWDGGGAEVTINAETPERVDALRGAIRLFRQWCAENPE